MKGLIGTIAVIVVFIIVGIMIVNTANDQQGAVSDDATTITKSIGNSFITAGIICILLLALIIIGVIGKKTGAF